MDVNSTLYTVRPAERRINPFKPEFRAAEGNRPSRIIGYASVFDKLSRNLGGFVERVNRTAFQTSKAQMWPDVVCRYNHSDNFVLGTIGGGTLRLDFDDTGLAYDVIPPQSRSDILELCERGDISSSSFAFRVPDGGDEWEAWQGNTLRRTLHDIELVDVAPVINPAYPDATAQARSVDGAIISLSRHFDADPTEIRSLLDDGKGMKLFKRSDRPSAPAAPAAPDTPEREEPAVSVKTAAEMDREARAKLTSKARKALPNSAFAYIDDEGVGHFPIHDASHVRNALARIAQGAKYGKEALPKVKAAAKKFGIDASEQNDWLDIMEESRDFPEWFWGLFTECDVQLAAEEEARAAADSADKDSTNTTDDEDEDDEDESGKGVEGEQRETVGREKLPGNDGKLERDSDNEEFLAELRRTRLTDLMGKKYDPYYFGPEENLAGDGKDEA